uniref:sushi, von Willebrand factor type A, EGF and pentraxin domain-containing protein 1-like n=1 Tax=Styela clava TaxID=7725 RepID=UPI00193A038A|nr:sushi, von Willebrand factor type A, EGF and pentraxin domain-containing protein 1-like [Styela clava]
MWKSTLALFALAVFSVEISEAVRCWKCDNGLTNDDCINKGQSVECAGEHGGCFSEIRYHVGLIPPIRITKRCKQGLACDNNEFQNDKGNHPYQCNPRIPESICRCCCEREDCNKPELGCLPVYPDCPELKIPRNAERDCKYDQPNIGEQCVYTCKEGFELVGEPVLNCMAKNAKESVWDNKLPRCKPKKCLPEYNSLINGNVECTNRNRVGSTCTFTCKSGYRLEGQTKATCASSENWDNQPPRCIRITCPPPMIPPTFGRVDCSDSNNGGSVCRFTCENGYQLLGSPTSTCVDDENGDQYGRWTSPVPRCGLLKCQPQSASPTNGDVTCSDGNNGRSKCEYSCQPGFAVVGSPSRTCEDDGDGDEIGEWSAREPSCQRIRCKPPRTSPQNGQVTCSDQNYIDSECTYTCNDGYNIVPATSEKTLCRDDGNGDATGEWSNPPPICGPGECLPVQGNPINGRVICSDSNAVRSVCRFTCDDGYYMKSAGGTVYPIATTDVICRKDNSWSQQPPTCEPITCVPPHESTDEKIVACTDSNNYRSVCTWECRDGTPIVGQIESECQDNDGTQYGKWVPENPVNYCNEAKCQPPLIAPQNGAVRCTDGRNALSVCSFMCDSGYYMVSADEQPIRSGEMDIDCNRNGEWSDFPPKCRPVHCDPKRENPENGFVSCSLDNHYGSICKFECIAGYELEGDEINECLDSVPGDEDGDWSNSPPVCRPAACTPRLVTPTNGAMSCSDGANFNSVCKFSCFEGYYMLSPADDAVSSNRWESLCRSDGTWSDPEPTCEPIYCLPEQTGPRHGDVDCTDRNNYKSRCTFTCNPGYRLSTPKATTDCLDDGSGDALGYWSDPKPECLPRACSPPQKAPINGKVSCSDGASFGSVCTFRCNKGYYQTTSAGDLVRSNDLKTECLDTNSWSRDPAKCRPIVCRPPHSAPEDGSVTCTKTNLYQSICSFKCKPGYEIAGEPKSACEDDGNGDEDGEWSSPAPSCSPSTCNPRLTAPGHGSITCTNANTFGSTCSFTCDEGYYMVANSRTIAGNEISSTCGPGRKWTRAPPTCRPITCIPPHRKPAHGSVSCTNKNFYRSECTFQCDLGYVMQPGRGGSAPVDGGVLSACGEDAVIGDAKGAWSEPAPSCTPDQCPVRTAPVNGRVTCSNGNLFGSVCTYVCNKGYFMRGPDASILKRNLLKTNCLESLTWSVEEPTCEPIICQPEFDDPVDGSVTCTNRNFHRSVCTFECDPGYKMIGRPKSVCEEAGGGNSEFGKWSQNPPTCKENLCDPDLPLVPENGRKSCSNANVLGSVCTFVCDRYHTRIGPQRSKCIETREGLRWSDPTPTCRPDLCLPPRETLEHGKVTCSRGNFVTSVCTFKCTEPGYSLYPKARKTNKCLPSKKWDLGPPCCTRPCPPNARMDAYVILDSSSSIGEPNWIIMKKFISSILSSFTISEDTTHFAVVRYNKFVDTDTQINLSDYTSDIAGLLAAFDRIPYNGSGTRTGQAIQHVVDNMMRPSNGNRPDVQDLVIVITDGKAQDDVKTPSDELRAKGAITFAIGIEPPGKAKLDVGQLEDIAGHPFNVLIAEDGFAGLDAGFALKITDKVCGDPCDN